jgi:hypothetical protein
MRVRQRPSTVRTPFTPRSDTAELLPAADARQLYSEGREQGTADGMTSFPAINFPATSNLGVGLLGHVLSLRAGMSYQALVCDRLGQNDNTLMPELKTRLAVGHNGGLTPVENRDIPTMAGAGALRSAANDILTLPRPISVSSSRRWARGYKCFRCVPMLLRNGICETARLTGAGHRTVQRTKVELTPRTCPVLAVRTLGPVWSVMPTHEGRQRAPRASRRQTHAAARHRRVSHPAVTRLAAAWLSHSWSLESGFTGSICHPRFGDIGEIPRRGGRQAPVL